MKITKSMYAALAVVAIALANPSLTLAKSTKSSDPEVPVMKGVTKTKQGFRFRRHPLFTGDHALEVQGGTIMLKNEKLLDYREKDGPLVGFYCFSEIDPKTGTTVCGAGEGSTVSMEEYAESIGLRPFVRYSNTFQDPYGNMVEAIIGCSKKFSMKECQDYISD